MTTAINLQESYDADGFYIASKPLIPSDLVERAVEGMDAVRQGEYDTGRPPEPSPWNPGDDITKLCKIEQPQFANHAIMELITHPALGEMAAEVTGAGMVQAWWVQLLYKPPTDAAAPAQTNIGLHQDWSYWRSFWEKGSELFTAWVALSDVKDDCGPMHFVQGSHSWGFLDKDGFSEQDLESQRKNIHLPAGAIWREQAAVLPPGAASFHHRLTLHGSGPNVSDSPRRSFAVHLRTEKSRPVGDRREGLAQFIDDPKLCPIIYKR